MMWEHLGVVWDDDLEDNEDFEDDEYIEPEVLMEQYGF